MPDRIGNAALLWSATSDASGQRVHLLQAPLRAIRPGHTQEVFTRRSVDRTVLEHITIGDGAALLRGRVRYDNAPGGLIDVITAGSNGHTLTYIPELSDPDVSYPCLLVEPLLDAFLDLDSQRGQLGDGEVELVFQQTDQASFDPLFHGSQVLFSYRAGGSLAASSSFGRVTSTDAPATFADISAGGGFGNLSTAQSNQARIQWMAAVASCGPREFPTLLLEGEAENLVPESEDFGTWNQNNAPVLSSGQADPYGGTAAYLFEDNSVVQRAGLFEVVTLASTEKHGVALYLKQGTTPPGGASQFFLLNNTAGVTLGLGSVTWSSGEPTLSVATGTTFSEPERWRDGFWRCVVLADGTSEPTDVHRMWIEAAAAATDEGDVYIFGAEVQSS